MNLVISCRKKQEHLISFIRLVFLPRLFTKLQTHLKKTMKFTSIITASVCALIYVAIPTFAKETDVPCECAAILCEFGSSCGYLEDGGVGCSPLSDHCNGIECASGSICVPEPKQCFTEPCPQYRCVHLDDPCTTSGCSNEICSDESGFSPCLWKDEYACLTDYGSCRRGGNGTCYWHFGEQGSLQDEYDSCVQDVA